MNWILQFIRFNGKRHPTERGKPEIARLLSHLALNRNIAPFTQNQAMNAIRVLRVWQKCFLYRIVGESKNEGIARTSCHIKSIAYYHSPLTLTLSREGRGNVKSSRCLFVAALRPIEGEVQRLCKTPASLYKHVLDLPIEDKTQAVRSRKPKRLSTFLSQAE